MLATYPIQGEKFQITRPIVHQVLNDLKRNLSVLPNDVDVVYLDEEGVHKEVGTATEENGQEGIRTRGRPVISVTVSEEYQDSSLLQYKHYDNEFKPIFHYPETGTDITPYYSHMEMRLSITYRAQSKANARAWLNGIKSKIRLHGDAFTHNLQYSYEVPRGFIHVLSKIYERIKTYNTSIENFSDWLTKHFVLRFGTVSDSAGLSHYYAVSEVQEQVHGFFDFNGVIEEGDKVDGHPSWNVSFSYLVRYMRPTSVTMAFPPVVYNQTMPFSLMGIDENGNVDKAREADLAFPDQQKEHTASSQYLYQYTSMANAKRWEEKSGIMVPYWAECQPEQQFSIRGTQRFVDQLVLFDPCDGPGTIIGNLAEPNGYTMDDNLIRFLIESEQPYLFTQGKSVFQLCMFQNNRLLQRDFIAMDKQGQITLNGDIMINKTYFMRLAIYYDWSLVDPVAIERLRNWGLEFYTLVERYGYNKHQLGRLEAFHYRNLIQGRGALDDIRDARFRDALRNGRRRDDHHHAADYLDLDDKASGLYYDILEFVNPGIYPFNNRTDGDAHGRPNRGLIGRTARTVQVFHTNTPRAKGR